jgi:hypothetical protein
MPGNLKILFAVKWNKFSGLIQVVIIRTGTQKKHGTEQKEITN